MKRIRIRYGNAEEQRPKLWKLQDLRDSADGEDGNCRVRVDGDDRNYVTLLRCWAPASQFVLMRQYGIDATSKVEA